MKKKRETGPLGNLLFNIVIPVFILNKLAKYLGSHGPVLALIIALSFPLAFAAYDYYLTRKRNWISLFGLLNVLLSGGFALVQLEGIYFAIKEAAIPSLMGIFVLGSAFTKRPFIEVLLFNESFMNVELVEKRLAETTHHTEFHRLLKRSTLLLCLSFFLSATLNFWLAQKVFVNIDPLLDEHHRSLILNEQIADMTMRSYLIIVLPSFIFLSSIMWYLFRGIQKFTQLEMSQIFKS